LSNGAYYCHPSMEGLLRSLNTGTYAPFTSENGVARLDGFPVRWVGVMPVYDTAVHAGQSQVYFGDLSYWYLGERSPISVETSRDVFFSTDELAVRALERFCVAAMAPDAMAVLSTANS